MRQSLAQIEELESPAGDAGDNLQTAWHIQWWQTGSLPKPVKNCPDKDRKLPEGSPELVFHGARVWPCENETISFGDACNAYRLVAELHGMLQAMLKSDMAGRAALSD